MPTKIFAGVAAERKVNMLPRINKLFAVAAVAVGIAAPAAFAGAPRYETRRIPMGPRPDHYVLVRSSADRGVVRPYALVGDRQVRTVRRVVQRWSGSRYVGPAWVTERVVE